MSIVHPAQEPTRKELLAVIERLTADNERLRAALAEIANFEDGPIAGAASVAGDALRITQQQTVNSEEGK
jgi:hypothetical protein